VILDLIRRHVHCLPAMTKADRREGVCGRSRSLPAEPCEPWPLLVTNKNPNPFTHLTCLVNSVPGETSKSLTLGHTSPRPKPDEECRCWYLEPLT